MNINHTTPDNVAQWILAQPLTKILELQTLLAAEGVSMIFETAEVQVIQEDPNVVGRPIGPGRKLPGQLDT